MNERITAPISDLFDNKDFMVIDFSSLQTKTNINSNITIWVKTNVLA